MGTRALIHIKDSNLKSKTLVTLYRQMDGYPAGLGKEILVVLADGQSALVNGYSNQSTPSHFNGMGCLAAYLVGNLKCWPYLEEKSNNIGNIYLVPPNTKDVGEEYTYILYSPNDRAVFITVKAGRKLLYNGPLREYLIEVEK
jgi:hypothetical protein